MQKYGFLFGAGAEKAYNLPSGGQFALNIFRQDATAPKQEFKCMRDQVNLITPYATDWLPNRFKEKNISSFGKSVFENIIANTVEHNRTRIIEKVNSFDEIADEIIKKWEGIEVDQAFLALLQKPVSGIKLSQVIEYNESFKNGNALFESNYFSALLLVYKMLKDDCSDKRTLKRILIAIMQLQLGALSEDLSRSINDNLFTKKDDEIDLFDDFGELIQINYTDTGVSGLELLLDKREEDISTSIGIVVSFAQKIIEHIYSSVLDYKSLIDSNWHNLYCPKADWAKFCKISIFLLTVRKYISELASNADTTNPDGYYNMIKKAIDDKQFETTAIATTNYNSLIEEILETDITYLNGSTSMWYDPYLNKVGTKEELNDYEKHIIVPLIFTQSGTKPMTAISMSIKYVKLYNAWKGSDAIVVVGFGFGQDDEHINGILRTLVNEDGKKIIIVTTDHGHRNITKEKAQALKITDLSKVEVIVVDNCGKNNGKRWVDYL